MNVRDWTLVECWARALRRVLRPSLGAPCYVLREENPLWLEVVLVLTVYLRTGMEFL